MGLYDSHVYVSGFEQPMAVFESNRSRLFVVVPKSALLKIWHPKDDALPVEELVFKASSQATCLH